MKDRIGWPLLRTGVNRQWWSNCAPRWNCDSKSYALKLTQWEHEAIWHVRESMLFEFGYKIEKFARVFDKLLEFSDE